MRTIATAAVLLAAAAALAAEKQTEREISALVDELDAPPAAAAPAQKPAVDAEAAPAQKSAADAPAGEATEQKPAVDAPAAEAPEVVVSKPGAQVKKHGKDRKPKKELTGRDAKITSETMSYDRKEGIIFFDRKVYVDDEQYQMHADRVYVFLSGTNDVKRLVALGNVALTNEFRSATCDKAVYVKAASKVVLYAPEGGVATLKDESERGGTITGSKITFWLDSEQVEVQQSDITVPGGAFKANDAKKLLGK